MSESPVLARLRARKQALEPQAEPEDESPETPRVRIDAALAPVVIAGNTDVRQPWERAKGEPEDAWCAFEGYCKMKPPRRMAEAGIVNHVHVSTAQLSTWYREWKWRDRVEAYDVLTKRIEEEHRQKIIAQNAEEVTAEHMSILKDARAIMANEMRKHLIASQNFNGPSTKLADLKGMLSEIVKTERLVRGETTEEVGHRTDLSDMSIEELKAWNTRLNKPSSEE